MKVGITGRSFCGKTTIFNALMEASQETESRGKRIGTISVPDDRVDFLSSVYEPKKISYATIQIEEVAGNLETSKELGQVLGELRQQDVLCVVLGAFQDPEQSPLTELNGMLDEMKLSDLVLVEKRLDRLQREGAKTREVEVLCRVKSWLEDENGLIQGLQLDEEDRQLFTGFRFLTDKPMLCVVNQDEKEFGKKQYNDLTDYTKIHGIRLMEMCAPLEWEISQLAPEERSAFLEDLNVSEPAVHRFIQTCYKLLRFISFFTVGPDEVKAWTITKGTSAVKAAGKIHSDIERGFIRAEVISYADFVKCGSESEAKAQGLAGLQGKTHVLGDGDIVNFKFNV